MTQVTAEPQNEFEAKEPLPKVYIAGFNVFRPNAQAFFEDISKLCDSLGLQALCPFDPNIDPHDTSAIYEHNIELLQHATCGVGDITPFRGSEPDSGTMWELGYLVARGFPTVVYTMDRRTEGLRQVDHFRSKGWNLRDNQPVLPDGLYRNAHATLANLMISKSAKKIVLGEVTDALIVLRDYLLETAPAALH